MYLYRYSSNNPKMSRMRTLTGQIVQKLCDDNYKVIMEFWSAPSNTTTRPWKQNIRRIYKMSLSTRNWSQARMFESWSMLSFFQHIFGKNRTNARIFFHAQILGSTWFLERNHTKFDPQCSYRIVFIKNLYSCIIPP